MSGSYTLRPERFQTLADLGVVITPQDEWVGEVGTPERRAIPLPHTVRDIDFGFSPEEWAAIAMREGAHYVGGCCGDMSALQDELNEAFRNDGSVEGYKLDDMARIALSHGGFDTFKPLTDEDFDRLVKAWRIGMLDPLDRLGVIYNVVEPAIKPGLGSRPYTPHSSHSAEHVWFGLLQSTLSELTFTDMFTHDREDTIAQHAANRLIRIARLLEPLRQLYQLLADWDVEFDGFALVSRESGQVMQIMGGLCIFDTRQRVEDVITSNTRVDAGFAAGVEILRATVNIHDGLVLHPAE